MKNGQVSAALRADKSKKVCDKCNEFKAGWWERIKEAIEKKKTPAEEKRITLFGKRCVMR